MFTRMVQVYNLTGTMKLFIGDIPYPKGTITDDTNLSRSVYPTPLRLFVKTRLKLISRFNRTDIT